MKSVSAYVLARLSEPSTLAGLALLFTSAQAAMQTHDFQSVAAALFGLGAMLFREGTAK
jgi:hypothetical protein